MTAVDSVDNMLANNAKSQPTSPRSNDTRLAPPSHVPEVSQPPHPLDDMSSGLVNMSAPTLTPHPPAHALSGTNMLSIQQSRQTKPSIKLPSQKASGQRPSQYRTGTRPPAANEKILRSSTSEKPARPQSGGVSRKTRAPSPIVMT
mmetsp:Transcript_5439/g.8950  ORF Transcript_5439/g.8950 Transcript_5439/m.8950 type:complete len:146 (-) Transcript_5439:106-543(-)